MYPLLIQSFQHFSNCRFTWIVFRHVRNPCFVIKSQLKQQIKINPTHSKKCPLVDYCDWIHLERFALTSPVPIIICDDSRLARNQMSRALQHWNVDITFAEHGLKALEAIRAGKGHVLFLDLNMPLMNGYEVLERIKKDDLPCITIVVSGDVQAKAKQKVLSLGAIGFIEKPISEASLRLALRDYGLESELQPQEFTKTHSSENTVSPLEHLREIANIAMGRTARQLSVLLNTFIKLPVPRVDHINFSELSMTLNQATSNQPVTTVAQGFVGHGISGEALLIFQESSSQHLAKLLNYAGQLNMMTEREVLMDIATVLTGSFFSNLSTLLNLSLSRGVPRIIGQHCEPPNLEQSPIAQEKLLCIEIDYQFGDENTHCDLLLLFTNDSLTKLSKQLEGVS